MRILIAGFQHETNTFARTKADYENFVRGEGFPPMVHGEDVLALRDVNIPMGGFVQAMEPFGHELIPVIWAGACPSAHVTRNAYERIASAIVEATRTHAPDAIYLDLHGAMVAEHIDDGEGELLARLRAVVGPKIPIVASLDLHANVTDDMLRLADGLIAFRTYPHIDMAETGARAATFLLRLLQTGRRPAMFSRRLPFLIPINAMCTGLQPARDVFRHLTEFDVSPVLSLSFAPGFPAADFPGCGPVVWGYGSDAELVCARVEALYAEICRLEADWRVQFLEPAVAVRRAIDLSRSARRPVVIADTQDNPTAGGDSNTVGLLQALVDQGASRAAVGLICDPQAAGVAHRAGLGAEIRIALGGSSGLVGDSPLEATFRVEALSDGECQFAGPMLTGTRLTLGPSACLSVGGVKVVVTSTKAPMIDRNLFRFVGIVPEDMAILVVKSSVHFRADFEPIAEEILVAAAPGPFIADPERLPWQHLPPGLRTGPLGRAFVHSKGDNVAPDSNGPHSVGSSSAGLVTAFQSK